MHLHLAMDPGPYLLGFAFGEFLIASVVSDKDGHEREPEVLLSILRVAATAAEPPIKWALAEPSGAFAAINLFAIKHECVCY